MILFKKVHIPMILGKTEYLKTKTRRVGRKRWNVGSTHNFQTNYRADSMFCRGKILSVHQEPLFNMTDDDAQDEGYATVEDFKKIWTQINDKWENIEVWVVEFTAIKKEVPSLEKFFTRKV